MPRTKYKYSWKHKTTIAHTRGYDTAETNNRHIKAKCLERATTSVTDCRGGNPS